MSLFLLNCWEFRLFSLVILCDLLNFRFFWFLFGKFIIIFIIIWFAAWFWLIIIILILKCPHEIGDNTFYFSRLKSWLVWYYRAYGRMFIMRFWLWGELFIRFFPLIIMLILTHEIKLSRRIPLHRKFKRNIASFWLLH